MDDSVLKVSWSMKDPPVAPVSWHVWPEYEGSTAGTTQEAELEAGLGWAAGTLSVLGEAFDMKLGRATGWESDRPEVRDAARVYKRGVARRRAGDKVVRRPLQGRYDLSVWTGATPPRLKGGSWQIVDGHVARHWPTAVRGADDLVITLTEHTKTLASVAQILKAAKAAGSPQAWRVLGGGILADVAAFAAGLAGATVEFVPTTLVAMADACVGGKTGVNFSPYGKNQLGLFYFPSAVYVWPGWLRTLPERELRAGSAECIKHLILAGAVPAAKTFAAAVKTRDETAIAAALPAIMDYKVQIVADDPAEIGRRAILNLGHTLGHALEALSQERTKGETTLLHGEAVGLGLLFSVLLSRDLGHLSEGAASELSELLHEAGCTRSLSDLQTRLGVADIHDPALLQDLKRLIGHDKKNTPQDDAAASWVLLQAVGTVYQAQANRWTTPVPMNALDATWQGFLSALGKA